MPSFAAMLWCTFFFLGSVSPTALPVLPVAPYYVSIRVPEPSDVAFDPETGHFFMVSDNGILYETDTAGTILRQSADKGWDYEGVEVKGNYVYVSDESPRRIYRYDKATLIRDRTYVIDYSGPRNSGFESITWNESKGCFVLVSEKDPVLIVELDEEFRPLNQLVFSGARDISSARWYAGSMYLLSDEDKIILRCDPLTYRVQQKFYTGILNAEGLAFDAQGRAWVVSDDLGRLYFLGFLPEAL